MQTTLSLGHGGKCDIKTQRNRYNSTRDQQITEQGVKLFNAILSYYREILKANLLEYNPDTKLS